MLSSESQTEMSTNRENMDNRLNNHRQDPTANDLVTLANRSDLIGNLRSVRKSEEDRTAAGIPLPFHLQRQVP
jgi:hypothetical protein